MSQQTNKKLYVGSLPYSTTEEELRNLFESFGAIESVRIVTDKFTGQSKGFGFVEMVNPEDARRAAEDMNGKPFNGRTLIVNDARPEQRREGGGGRSERSFNGPRRDRWGGDREEGRSFRSRRD